MTSGARMTAVAERAVLVTFSDHIDDAAWQRVRGLDAALSAAPFPGFTEAVPAYASILVAFDPLLTDHGAVTAALQALTANHVPAATPGQRRTVQICYDPPFDVDLAGVAERTGLAPDAVIAAHLAGRYTVSMYGFAPGYAYLAGVSDAIALPRKERPVRDVPAGSVIIAGIQCLVTTLTMPTGWWIIGRSPTAILRPKSDRPFLFDVGDVVAFERIDRAQFDRAIVSEGAAA
jgi:inhibitor of KinA